MVANIVALAAMAEITGIVSRRSLEKALLARVPRGTEDLNRRALNLGIKLARERKMQDVAQEENMAEPEDM
jgi:2-oxoglutarate ferredoxin oxidoreductase subunit gamma